MKVKTTRLRSLSLELVAFGKAHKAIGLRSAGQRSTSLLLRTFKSFLCANAIRIMMSGESNHNVQKTYPQSDDTVSTSDPQVMHMQKKYSQCYNRASFLNPQALHTVFKGDQGRSIRVPRFTTHTVPDVTVNTRVVAVVGIQQENAAPQVDGWFLSVFFAFWNVVKG